MKLTTEPPVRNQEPMVDYINQGVKEKKICINSFAKRVAERLFESINTDFKENMYKTTTLPYYHSSSILRCEIDYDKKGCGIITAF